MLRRNKSFQFQSQLAGWGFRKIRQHWVAPRHARLCSGWPAMTTARAEADAAIVLRGIFG